MALLGFSNLAWVLGLLILFALRGFWTVVGLVCLAVDICEFFFQWKKQRQVGKLGIPCPIAYRTWPCGPICLEHGVGGSLGYRQHQISYNFGAILY